MWDLDDSGDATLEVLTRTAAADARAGGPPGGLLLLLYPNPNLEPNLEPNSNPDLSPTPTHTLPLILTL